MLSISKQIDEFRTKLEANSFFQGLEGGRTKEVFKRVNGKIENVKDAVFLTRKEITNIRGIDSALFDGIYILLSSHVHSYNMGTSLVGRAIILDEIALLHLLLIIKYAGFYLALAVIDATLLFPEIEGRLNFELKQTLNKIKQGKNYDL